MSYGGYGYRRGGVLRLHPRKHHHVTWCTYEEGVFALEKGVFAAKLSCSCRAFCDAAVAAPAASRSSSARASAEGKRPCGCVGGGRERISGKRRPC